jgi:predicted exporter
LRQGLSSRFILVGIEGGSREQLIEASKRLAASLRGQAQFVSVANGEPEGIRKDREFLWSHRYLLSPTLTPGEFTSEGLRHRLEEDLRLLASPVGMLVRDTLAADPGREMLRLAEQLGGMGRRNLSGGAWLSDDGLRALLVAQTQAPAYDTDAQSRALEAIRNAFRETTPNSGMNLLLSGPAVFSVNVRNAIEGDAFLFSIIATVLVGGMLLALYRSVLVLGLGLLPVASGALAGIAAVSLAFGSVHGITLGFGITLLGEGVDYAIYLFTRVSPTSDPRSTFERIWPTLRLGMLTSICGFGAMLLSGFTGLSQLGLLSIVGLIVAAAVTREILPALLPAGFSVAATRRIGSPLAGMVRRAPALRMALALTVVACAGVLVVNRDALWADDISRLSPVPAEDIRLDQRLRADLGAPDIRHLVVLRGRDEEEVLQASERVAQVLRDMVGEEKLAGFEAPSTYLPSKRAQRERQEMLPGPAELRDSLTQALRGLPFRPNLFEPFERDVAAARTAPFVDRQALQGTHFAAAVNSLLGRSGEDWVAVLSLRGVRDADAIAAGIGTGGSAVMLDLKRDSGELYRAYRSEAVTHCLLGLAAIVVLLAVALRSWRSVLRVLAPLVAAVIVAMGLLVLGGTALTIFHLVGLVLVVAIGSNYSLFFDREPMHGEDGERTIASVVLANLTAVLAFGLLAFSKVPVLHALGATVAMGAIMALVFSAILMGRRSG